uniref:Antimicrobial peptide microplusin n=1 Tax=Amblyomma tuberculatum TaxID=48802 RepID=A0A6M2E1F2_9ACAR
MKAFLVCVLVAAFAAVSFAHHLELCDKNDGQLKSELRCIRRSISTAANRSFDNAARDLRCRNDTCVIRKLCVGNDLEKAMAKYFTRAQIGEIHEAATACDPSASHHH